MNQYAIFIAISDNYSFAAANLLMGLNRHSPELMKKCDFIIYHNGISEKNRSLLTHLHDNILFKDMVFPESWELLLNHDKTLMWGPYVICKLFGFSLIEYYDKVLFLDADMLIRGDISDLFEIEEEIAWRPIMAWDIQKNFKDLIPSWDTIHAGSGGLQLYTNKLRKYHIHDRDIVSAFDKIKNLKRGGTDECILSWIVYERKIILKELNFKVYDTPALDISAVTKIVHFLDYKPLVTKPWKNLAAYLYFSDWAADYEKWIAMGGEGLVKFDENDYFELFRYDLAQEIRILKKELKNTTEELKKTMEELHSMQESQFWKITKPFRWIIDQLRKIIVIL